LGGIQDQPAGLLDKIDAVLNVYRAFKIYHAEGAGAGEMAKWRKENSEVWDIVSDVNRIRNG